MATQSDERATFLVQDEAQSMAEGMHRTVYAGTTSRVIAFEVTDGGDWMVFSKLDYDITQQPDGGIVDDISFVTDDDVMVEAEL